MKYYVIQSSQNTRGVWVQESDVDDTVEYNFDGHKKITVTEISEAEYFARIYG